MILQNWQFHTLAGIILSKYITHLVCFYHYNNLQDGLLSLVRGGTDHSTLQQQLEKFRNSNVNLRDWHLGDGARRMSITNAIDILRRHVLRAIKRKKDKHLVILIQAF